MKSFLAFSLLASSLTAPAAPHVADVALQTLITKNPRVHVHEFGALNRVSDLLAASPVAAKNTCAARNASRNPVFDCTLVITDGEGDGLESSITIQYAVDRAGKRLVGRVSATYAG
jgi:hypothetical protein